MEELLLLSIGFGVGLSGAIAPGPLFTATIKDSLKHGPLSGPMICIGHLLIEVPIVIGLALGVSYIINIPFVRALIGVMGGVGLFCMGVQIIRERKKFEKVSEVTLKGHCKRREKAKSD